MIPHRLTLSLLILRLIEIFPDLAINTNSPDDILNQIFLVRPVDPEKIPPRGRLVDSGHLCTSWQNGNTDLKIHQESYHLMDSVF